MEELIKCKLLLAKLLIQRYKKHRIIYHVKDNNVVILAVIHTRLDVKKAIRSIKKGIN